MMRAAAPSAFDVTRVVASNARWSCGKNSRVPGLVITPCYAVLARACGSSCPLAVEPRSRTARRTLLSCATTANDTGGCLAVATISEAL
jgi:hypothetical protein